jgi:hypothetical protein
MVIKPSWNGTPHCTTACYGYGYITVTPYENGLMTTAPFGFGACRRIATLRLGHLHHCPETIARWHSIALLMGYTPGVGN